MSDSARAPLNEPGRYRYLPGLTFASGGVAAEPGHAIVRGVLERPLPVEEAFAAIRGHLESLGRPAAALCGMELRLPAALDLEGFRAFNREYLAGLDGLDLRLDGVTPLTRTNVAPSGRPLERAMVLACSYTVPEDAAFPGFVISGIAELPEATKFPEGVVRPGESSPDALRDKTECVIDVIQRYLRELDVRWDSAASLHLYSVHPSAPGVCRDVLADRGLVPADGIVWHSAAPPVAGLEVEVDLRRYARQVMLPCPARPST